MDIAFESGVAEALADLYAALGADELTEETFELSRNIIEAVNAAEYSAWELRWRCFVVLDAKAGPGKGHLVEMERAMMRRVATASPKNYQLWNHRRKLALYCAATLGNDPAVVLAEELEFTAGCLEVDTKNYHAWGHRQAVLRALGTANDMEREFAFVTGMLERDVMNNSAWAQRAFLMDLLAMPIHRDAHVRTWTAEFDETIQWIEKCVDNESSWAYLARVLRNLPHTAHRAYAEFLARMLRAHPTSVEAGAAALSYYKLMRDREHDDAMRQHCTQKMNMIRRRLMALDGRRASRWNAFM